LVPRISLRRQIRFGIPVAVERFRGRQYRCLRCNGVFYELDELDAHIRRERPGPDSPELPVIDAPLLVRIFYSRDVREEWGERLHDRD
jgi:hypothetical protein